MNIESNIFSRYTPDFKKIKNYGFKLKNDEYYIERQIKNGEFKAVIKINNSGQITGTVYDVENNEEYLPLRLENQQGAFVGEIKTEYESVLIDIREKCFNQNYFVSKQGNRIAQLILKKYGDSPVFMWEKFPTFGVYKNPENNKWYGLIMNIERFRLGEESEDFVEVMNLKLDKDKIPDLVKKDGFYSAWHMNKKYWVSLSLDDTLSDAEVMKCIEESHSYTEKKVKK